MTIQGEPDEGGVLPEVEHDEHEGLDAESLREHEEVTKVKNVQMVELGKYRMETWYYSPFPKVRHRICRLGGEQRWYAEDL
jgi:hypothetical protein